MHEKTRIRTWKKLCYVGGVPVAGYPSPRLVMGNIDEHGGIYGTISLFVDKVFRRKFSYPDVVSLHTFTKQMRVVSWNTGGVQMERNKKDKIGSREMAHHLLRGPVLLQETKVGDRGHGLSKITKMSWVRDVPAVRGKGGGLTGGLAWIVPQNLGYAEVSQPDVLIPGLLGIVRICYLGVPVHLVNVYAPPGERKTDVPSSVGRRKNGKVASH